MPSCLYVACTLHACIMCRMHAACALHVRCTFMDAACVLPERCVHHLVKRKVDNKYQQVMMPIRRKAMAESSPTTTSTASYWGERCFLQVPAIGLHACCMLLHAWCTCCMLHGMAVRFILYSDAVHRLHWFDLSRDPHGDISRKFRTRQVEC